MMNASGEEGLLPVLRYLSKLLGCAPLSSPPVPHRVRSVGQRGLLLANSKTKRGLELLEDPLALSTYWIPTFHKGR